MRVFWLDRREAVRRIALAARRVVEARPEVEAVWLFGSLAEGRAVPGSDADVLLVLTGSDARWLDRSPAFGAFFADVGLGIDLFCYTRAEAERNPFARAAMAHALPLAGRPGEGPAAGDGLA